MEGNKNVYNEATFNTIVFTVPVYAEFLYFKWNMFFYS